MAAVEVHVTPVSSESMDVNTGQVLKKVLIAKAQDKNQALRCSVVVIKDFGEENPALNVVKELLRIRI